MNERKLPPIHPGEILLEEFLEPMGISQYRLAKDISVPARRINEIVKGKRAISPDTALRLSRYFGLSERFWLNLQTRYDLEVEKDKLADRLERDALARAQVEDMSEKDIAREIKRLEKLMMEHARNLEFEKAAMVRDQLHILKEQAFGAPGADNVVGMGTVSK